MIYHFGNVIFFISRGKSKPSTMQAAMSRCNITAAGHAGHAGLPDHMSLKAPLLQRSTGHHPPNTAAFSEAPGTNTSEALGVKAVLTSMVS